MLRHHLLAAAASGLALFAAGAASADSIAYNAPNFINTPGSTSVSIGGSTFVNQGLVGTARLPANLADFNGETLGSFSGMAIDLKTWRRDANGVYTASLFTLPDRGPNNIGGFTTTNYAARLNKFTMSLNPYTGSAALASSTQQMTLTQAGGIMLKDETGQVFTGRDPQSGVLVRGGVAYPTPPAGDPGAGKIALDAEAVTFLPDGSFYIGDEYAAGIYYFDATGKQVGGIQANPDLLPRVNGVVNFNGTNDSPLVPGTTGRRSNQGMEGLSVSPDGTRLIAVLQSATLQDNPTNVAVRRNNTRVVVYDISASRTPTTPIAEYVLQLPVYNNSATGVGTASATAAQSEVLALNNTQFLVLSRDGNGRGTNGNANAIAYKSILLVDTAGATNIAGTPFSGTTPISTTAAGNASGLLNPSITPVQQVELVNMLNTAQLSKFGVNTVTAPSTQYTLSEKWEAMGLVPVLEEDKPHDFFLLVGNDNDFVSNDIDAAGVVDANAALNSATAGVGNNDNVMMVYRLTLPTYMDPQALAWLKATTPISMASARVVGSQIGAAAALAGLENLSVVRRAYHGGLDVAGTRAWAQGALDRISTPGAFGRIQTGGFAAGLESGTGAFRYGLAVSGTYIDSDEGAPFDAAGHAYGGAVYGGWFDPSGAYIQGSVGASSLKLKLRRPSSYGLVARGDADGRDINLDLKVGFNLKVAEGARFGPFLEVLYNDVDLDGYAERGAAVGDALVADSRYRRTEGAIGLEAVLGGSGRIRPSARIGYTTVDEGGDRDAVFTLAAVPGSATTLALPTSDKNFLQGGVAVEGEIGGFGWRASLDARDTRGDASGRVALGISKRF